MAVTLTPSGSLNTTLDNYFISVLSNTSSVNLGAVSLKFNVPGGVIVKDVNAGISTGVSFLQKDKKLNVGFFTGSNWTVNNGTLILSITASGMATGSFTLDTDEDWYNEFASSSGDIFQNFDIRMPTLASDLTRVSDQLGVNSILSGINPSVNAPSSSVFGFNSTTRGTASFAEGVGTLASGFAAHAAGVNTTASGYAAFSVGIETDADGSGSFAAGSGSWARGTATVAFGIGTIASSSGQLVIGHYNEAMTDFNNIFVVGDGTGPSSANRKNIFEVYGGIGAIGRGIKIDTAPSPTRTTTIDGFQVYGKTNFWGPVTQSGNIITIDGDFGGPTHTSASYIAETYNSLGQLRGRTLLNYKGIDFNNSFQTTAPSSTHLWTNSSNRLFYGSDAIILNDGNNTGAVGSPLTIGTINASNLQLETNNTTRVFISGSGNVGIGTNLPTERLHVDGNLLVTGRITAEEFHTEFVSASIIYQSGSTQFGNSSDDTHIFTGSLRVNGSITGSLFGTSSWAQNALTASFITPTGTNAFVQGGNSFGATALLGTNDNQNLQLETSGSVRMTISSSGNVGIGTTTPSVRLQVSLPSNTSNQNIFRSDAGDNLLAINTFPTTNRMQLLLGDYNGTATPNLAAISDSNTGIQWAGSDIIRFVNGGSENVTINASGNVGIGTATPSSRLHARGSGATSATTALRVENSNATASLVVRDDGNVGIGITSPTDLLDVFSSSDNQRLIRISHPTAPTQAAGFFGFNSDGVTNNVVVTLGVQYSSVYYNVINIKRDTQNVGIGTTSPTSRLQVRGSGATSATTALRVENSNQNASLVVLDDGTVGIGTTAPSASLHVQGNLQISTGSLYTYGQNTDIDSGSIRTVMSVATGSYRAAFFDYVLNKSTNARAGIVFSVWNGTSVEWNDVSTNDIGNTTEVNLSVGLSGANVVLYASSSTNDWSVKALARMI